MKTLSKENLVQPFWEETFPKQYFLSIIKGC